MVNYFNLFFNIQAIVVVLNKYESREKLERMMTNFREFDREIKIFFKINVAKKFLRECVEFRIREEEFY